VKASTMRGGERALRGGSQPSEWSVAAAKGQWWSAQWVAAL